MHGGHQTLLGSLSDTVTDTCGIAAVKLSSLRSSRNLQEYEDLQSQHKVLKQAQVTFAAALAAAADRPPANVKDLLAGCNWQRSGA